MRNLSHSRPRRLVVVVVLMLALLLTACGRGDKEANLRLKDANTGAGVTQAGQSPTESVEATAGQPKSEAPAASAGGSKGDSASGGNSSGGTSSKGDAPSGNSSGSDKGATPQSGMKVRIMFWNDTNSKDPKGAEIIVGPTSYKPNTSSKSGTGVIGPCAYGKTLTLVVYPDGRDGKKIEVPFKVTTSMEAASERDAVHVSISDDKVRVLGNAIDNFDQTFNRF